MTDLNNQNPATEDGRPRLRCPACSFMVPLPAETCPKCRANLRSGQIPVAEEPDSNRGRMIIAGLVLLVIIALAAIFLSGVLDGPQSPATGLPSSSDGIGEALDAFQDLPSHNQAIRPDVILNRAKDKIGEAEDRRKMEKDAEQFYPQPGVE